MQYLESGSLNSKSKENIGKTSFQCLDGCIFQKVTYSKKSKWNYNIYTR